MTASSTGPLLELDNVTISYQRRRDRVDAVRGVSLIIQPGEAYGLVGESGCGKSTLAMAVMRHLPRNGILSGGQVLFEDRDLFRLNQAELRRVRGGRIAMVYQNPESALNPTLKVGEQVAEVFRLHRALRHRPAAEAALDMLRKVRIAEPDRVVGLYPYQLSGGMRQRVVIAMALAADPALLVLDEPTTALDATVQADILDLFTDLRGEMKAAILFISHNLAVVQQVCDRIGVMYGGELIEQGTVAEVFKRPRHPYTAALFDCIPDFGVRKSDRRLAGIAGGVPDLAALGTACLYEPRCLISRQLCRVEHPDLMRAGSRHLSRCFFHAETPAPGAAARVRPEAVPVPDVTAGIPLLSLHGVGRRYGRAHILKDIDLEIAPGETFGLVGESGSGKSTLAKVISGLVPPSAGTVALAGERVAGQVGKRTGRQRRDVQMVFQTPDTTLNPRKKVASILGRAVRVLAGLGGKRKRDRSSALLGDVQLPVEMLRATPDRLSGGQRQRVAIARAFAGDPRLVILDEPTSALDVSVQASILNLLLDLQRESQAAYLFISHDLAVVRYLSDRIGVMYLGELVEVGPTERVFRPPFHPYTQALIAAVPRLGGAAPERPVSLDKPAPGPSERPEGCPFQTRCPRAYDRCRAEAPPWRDAGEGHMIRCWVALDALEASQSAALKPRRVQAPLPIGRRP
ncbi:ABC transporter ATP-binding protein [Skermanella stibiiresistens SB22]|uniref:ABC transporter ATP-binding protein n=1 Tax=Skermanella stibiiresistens SB22 TaxID=1385369 RepID=W9HAJ5_9PROT|nr:ABC transporter ATP-binding protein [Skermanella stibiiresistens]EWY41761.1 ABC transporter ATP-binding protein [Skermanella stibiiresistens SB22]